MNRVVGRANNNANARGGLAYIDSNYGFSFSNGNNGGRLAIMIRIVFTNDQLVVKRKSEHQEPGQNHIVVKRPKIT